MKNNPTIVSLGNIACEKNIPLSATIELLTKCNLKCRHCYIPKHDDIGLDTNKIVNLLYDLREVGTLNLVLTGGEIFLRKDIFDIIETARTLHFRVFLISNANLLDEEMISRLAKLHITEFAASVYSLNSCVHDNITKVSGSLDKTLNNLLTMKKYHIPVLIKTPLMKDNYIDYKELKEFCRKNDFEIELTPVITSRNDGDTSPHSLRIDEQDITDIIRETEFNTADNKANITTFNPEDKPCRLIFSSIYIDCKGNTYPCNSYLFKVGNIFENSISEIWNNSQLLKELKRIKKKDLYKCIDCDLKNFCKRCPGLALSEDHDLYGCSSVDKSLACARCRIVETIK